MSEPVAHLDAPGGAPFRIDFQALRGLAILLVLFHHMQLPFLRSGYLGVDIFFVISGFLITRIIQEAIDQGNFSFKAFYFRRAKRLLPAAYVTLLVTTVVAVFMLAGSEQSDYLRQLIGAVTFTGNIALWLQTGYFEQAAELKPLLHVWSLAIEEQYYLLLPASLVLIPRRHWILAMGMLLAASLALCLYFAASKPGATFYLLPTRAWELAMGSFGTLAFEGKSSGRFLARLFWPALAALVLLPLLPSFGRHPGAEALAVCCSTLVVMLRRHPLCNETRAARALAKVGDFSYSLYLVHWPVFAFANHAFVSDVPLQVRFLLSGLSLVLGYLLYRYVERPMRRAHFGLSRRSVGTALAASLALVLLAATFAGASRRGPDFTVVRSANRGFGDACDFDSQSAFRSLPDCRNSDTPGMLVWGDSFAMHLVPGIAASTEVGVAQATKSKCGPFIDMAPLDETDHQRPWAETCLAFNASVLAYLSATPSIKTVVLSSPFSPYLEAESGPGGSRILGVSNGTLQETAPSTTAAIGAMASLVRKIRQLGKRVVVVAPPPSSDFDIGECLERRATGRLVIGADANCRVPLANYQAENAVVLGFLARLPKEANVEVISFDGFLCSDRECLTSLDHVFLYRDAHHLSKQGSKAIAARMHLTRLILERAK